MRDAIVKYKIVAIICLFASSTITAHADDYRWVIERLSRASGDAGPEFEMYKSNYVGKEFSVERNSGVMAGILKNSYVTKPQVIDLGSKDNSYKAVTTLRKEQGAGFGSNIYALTVLEHVEAPKKPFVFLSNDIVFFGSCVHF
jgi:hypothetical protein